MLITAIKRVKGGLLAVMCGEEQVALLDDKTIEEHDFGVGCDVPESVVEELQFESDCRRALTAGLYLVGRREVCRDQVIKKLEPNYGIEAAQSAADELEKLGFVNDRRFAEMQATVYFEDRHFYKRRVIFELTRKGVPRDIAQEVCEELAPDEEEAIKELLEGRLGRDLDTDAGRRRTCATLERYGYSPYTIRSVIRHFGDDENYF
ncbi:MAG: regulatory protein RecX [Clostridia bacterium]|nr:regulatory protein RecX [Oscillospiraceae bacterium]MBQ6796569.1 regulatory protein RecX [Clostridia bacterium]